jgi:hypothetical protein
MWPLGGSGTGTGILHMGQCHWHLHMGQWHWHPIYGTVAVASYKWNSGTNILYMGWVVAED